MSCTCATELRRIASVARLDRRLVEAARVEHAGPPVDGIERGPELVRERGQELILAPIQGLGLAPGFLRAREQRLALRLEAPPLRDVARHLRGAHDAPGGVPDRRHGEGDLDEPAVLGPPDRLEVIDPLALDEAGQDLAFLGVSVLRNDQRDVLAHRLGRGIAEDPFGPRVPGRDDPLEGLAHDGIVRGVHDGREPGRVHDWVVRRRDFSRPGLPGSLARSLGHAAPLRVFTSRHFYRMSGRGSSSSQRNYASGWVARGQIQLPGKSPATPGRRNPARA